MLRYSSLAPMRNAGKRRREAVSRRARYYFRGCSGKQRSTRQRGRRIAQAPASDKQRQSSEVFLQAKI